MASKPNRIKMPWRLGFMTVTIAFLAVFAIAIFAVNSYVSSNEHNRFALVSAQLRTESIARVLNEQAQLTTNEHDFRHNLADSFESDATVNWSELVEGNPNAFGTEAQRVATSTGTDQDLVRSLIELAHRSAPQSTHDDGVAVYVAQVLGDGHILLVSYDRSALAGQLAPQRSMRWMMGFGFLMVISLIILGAIQYNIRAPLHRLDKALKSAETTLELNVDQPLPNNEIGWFAQRISDWLTRLRQTQARLMQMAIVVDRTNSAAMILDRKLRVQWVNGAFERMSGYSADEIKGKLPTDFLIGKNANAEARQKFLDAIRAGEGCVQEIEANTKDGGQRWVSAELEPVRDERGRVTGWVGINTDITDLKNTQEELASRIDELERVRAEQAKTAEALTAAKRHAEMVSRSKSDFLANMSHEIRTPMNGVLGMAEVLKTTELTEDQGKYLDTIKESGEALLTILNDILDLSKLEAGKVEIAEEPLEIRHIAEAVTRLLKARADEKKVALKVSVEEDVPEILLGDPGRLRQIVTNLVGNAIKFTDHGQIELHVACRDSGKGIRVEVRDTGSGIPEDLRNRLFKRFEQGNTAHVPGKGGTGLGLSICQELVRLMDGDIGVESVDGEGSTFWFEVPLKEEHAADRGVDMQSGETQAGPKRRLRILMAEDHPVNQSLMKAFITKLGHDFEIAEDGVEAVKAVRNEDFDLILMDVQMPRMDGVMATKVIRSLETPAAKIPIIAVTAHAMTGQREHYLAAGMNGYVSKPVQLATLGEEINRVLDEFGTSEPAAEEQDDAAEEEAPVAERKVS